MRFIWGPKMRFLCDRRSKIASERRFFSAIPLRKFLAMPHLLSNFAREWRFWALVAQCSTTPASVAATPPCSATPFQRQLDVRHSWQKAWPDQGFDYQTCPASWPYNHNRANHARPWPNLTRWTACPGQCASHSQSWRPYHWAAKLRALARRQNTYGAPEHSITKEFLQEELTKCRAYGQSDGFNLQTPDKGMTPVVLEQYGRTAPGAQAIFEYSTASSTTAYKSLSDRNPILLCKDDCQLRAVGSDLLHAAPSSMAGSRRVCSPESAKPTWETHQTACLTPPGSLSEQRERMRA